MVYENPREKLLNVRKKVLTPETEVWIQEEKSIYQDRQYKELFGEGYYRPFNEYKKWLGVLGGKYAGAGLAKAVVKEYLIQETRMMSQNIINSVSIDTSNAMGSPQYNPVTLEEFPYYYPYHDENAIVDITVTLASVSLGGGGSQDATEDKIDRILSYFDDYEIIDNICEKIVADFLVTKEQINLRIIKRSREERFEFLTNKRLELLKKRFKSIGKLSNRKNYKYSNEDWIHIKNQIIEELIKLTEKFEGSESAETFENMLAMFDSYKVKVEKKKAINEELLEE